MKEGLEKRKRAREESKRKEERRRGKERKGKAVPRTRMESIRGGKCVLLVPHACFSAWGGQTREFPRGWIKAAAPSPPLVQPSGPRVCAFACVPIYEKFDSIECYWNFFLLAPRRAAPRRTDACIFLNYCAKLVLSFRIDMRTGNFVDADWILVTRIVGFNSYAMCT